MTKRKLKLSEDGATLVEAAFVFPVVVMLTLAIFEFGLYWRNDLTVSQVSRDASRAAAAAGSATASDPLALGIPEGDVRALRVVRSLAKAGGIGDIKSVLVYKPSVVGTSSEPKKYIVPTDCISGTGNSIVTMGSSLSKCNSYPLSVLNLSGTDVDFSIMRLYSGNWTAVQRCDRYSTVLNSEPDLIGVMVNSYYTSATQFPPLNMLSGAQTAQVVTRIEPQNTSSAACS